MHRLPRIAPILTALLLSGLWLHAPCKAQLVWRQTGGPEGGYISGIVVSMNGTMFASAHAQLYRSTDKGAHWVRVGAGEWNSDITALTVTPNDIVLVGNPNGLFRSNDLGQTWSHSYYHDSTSSVVHLGVAPNGWIYMVLGTRLMRSMDEGVSWQTLNVGQFFNLAFKPDGAIFSYTLSDIIRSDDGGYTWKVIKSGFVPGARYVRGVGLNTRGDVFADTEDGMYISGDNGSTWRENNQGPRFSLFIIMPGGDLVAGSGELFRSRDYGLTWTKLGVSGVTAIATAPNGNLLAATTNGLFQLPYDASDWATINTGLVASDVQSVTALPDGTALAGTMHNGVYRSDKGMQNWTRQTQICSPAVMCADRNGVVLAGSSGILFRSADTGRTWDFPPTPQGTYGLKAVACNSVSCIAGFAAGGLARSEDRGRTWVSVSGYGFDTVGVAAVLATRTGVLYLATGSGAVYSSVNDGISWALLGSLPPGLVPTALCLTESGVLLAGTDKSGLYRSRDNGRTWAVCPDVPLTTINSLLSIRNYGLLAGLDAAGVMRSGNDGATWSAESAGLPPVVHSLAVTPAGEVLAGTAGQGVFAAQTGVSSVGLSAQSLSSLLPYPNPADNTVSIRCDAVAGTLLSLKLFDNLGHAVLSRALLCDGTGLIQLDISSVPDGVYRFVVSAARMPATGQITVMHR